MKGSLLIVGAFAVGCFVGRMGWLPSWLLGGALSLWVLYALMLQVGIGIGSDARLKEIFRNITPRTVLVPCATIVGTIVASVLVSFALVRWSAACGGRLRIWLLLTLVDTRILAERGSYRFAGRGRAGNNYSYGQRIS